jgi:3-oxoacyl-[acyl-carrier-protein] synthase II
MQRRDIVVTGLGVVTGNASNLAEFRETLLEGRSAIGPLRPGTADGWPVSEAAELDPASLERCLSGYAPSGLSRDQRVAFAPVPEALAGAGLLENPPLRRRMAVIVGCVQYHGREDIAEALGETFELGSPRVVVDAACSAGAHALGLAYQLVARGAVDLALACGFNTLLLKDVAGLFKAGILTRGGPLRPFDKNRTGTYAGEGSAAVVVESRGHAVARGARVYADLLGFGGGSDAHDIVPPHHEGRGLHTAISNALRDARVRPEQVKYVNAHGTGTKLNDPCETAAIRGAFGAAAYGIPVSSTKPITGHTLGAAGVIEAVATLLAVHEGFVPATLNHEVPDAACDLDYVPGSARRQAVELAVSNSSGFGGVYSALVFGKHQEGAV